MNEVINVKIKKRTLWILLVVFFASIFYVIFWLTRRKIKDLKEAKTGEEETVKLMVETKEKAMRLHIKHIDEGVKFRRRCEICRGFWL